MNISAQQQYSKKFSSEDYITQFQNTLTNIKHNELDNILEILLISIHRNNNIFMFGNGGSAATALHMATDFTKTIEVTKLPIKANCLNANISLMTALANDNGYENIFSDQLEQLLSPNDIVIGISASGNSPNCVKAFELALKKEAITIGLLGFNGGKMKSLSKHYFHVAVDSYCLAEDVHMIASHFFTDGIKNNLNFN